MGIFPGAAGKPVLDIAVIRMPHISNFDDFDPLRREPGVSLRYVETRSTLGTPDLIILPGTKTTMADLAWLRAAGFDRAIAERHEQSTPVIGICGGHQMLGQRIADPDRIESAQAEAAGLGLLPVTTVFRAAKTTTQSRFRVRASRGLLASCGTDEDLHGYEIHMGITTTDLSTAPFQIVSRSGEPVVEADGAMSPDGTVLGTYMHGLFLNNTLRRAILDHLAAKKGIALPPPLDFDQDREYEKLADVVEKHLDMTLLCELSGLQDLWRPHMDATR